MLELASAQAAAPARADGRSDTDLFVLGLLEAAQHGTQQRKLGTSLAAPPPPVAGAGTSPARPYLQSTDDAHLPIHPLRDHNRFWSTTEQLQQRFPAWLPRPTGPAHPLLQLLTTALTTAAGAALVDTLTVRGVCAAIAAVHHVHLTVVQIKGAAEAAASGAPAAAFAAPEVLHSPAKRKLMAALATTPDVAAAAAAAAAPGTPPAAVPAGGSAAGMSDAEQAKLLGELETAVTRSASLLRARLLCLLQQAADTPIKHVSPFVPPGAQERLISLRWYRAIAQRQSAGRWAVPAAGAASAAATHAAAASASGVVAAAAAGVVQHHISPLDAAHRSSNMERSTVSTGPAVLLAVYRLGKMLPLDAGGSAAEAAVDADDDSAAASMPLSSVLSQVATNQRFHTALVQAAVTACVPGMAYPSMFTGCMPGELAWCLSWVHSNPCLDHDLKRATQAAIMNGAVSMRTADVPPSTVFSQLVDLVGGASSALQDHDAMERWLQGLDQQLLALLARRVPGSTTNAAANSASGALAVQVSIPQLARMLMGHHALDMVCPSLVAAMTRRVLAGVLQQRGWTPTRADLYELRHVLKYFWQIPCYSSAFTRALSPHIAAFLDEGAPRAGVMLAPVDHLRAPLQDHAYAVALSILRLDARMRGTVDANLLAAALRHTDRATAAFIAGQRLRWERQPDFPDNGLDMLMRMYLNETPNHPLAVASAAAAVAGIRDGVRALPVDRPDRHLLNQITQVLHAMALAGVLHPHAEFVKRTVKFVGDRLKPLADRRVQQIILNVPGIAVEMEHYYTILARLFDVEMAWQLGLATGPGRPAAAAGSAAPPAAAAASPPCAFVGRLLPDWLYGAMMRVAAREDYHDLREFPRFGSRRVLEAAEVGVDASTLRQRPSFHGEVLRVVTQACTERGLPLPVSEGLLPGAGRRVDILWPRHKVAVEVDGESHYQVPELEDVAAIVAGHFAQVTAAGAPAPAVPAVELIPVVTRPSVLGRLPYTSRCDAAVAWRRKAASNLYGAPRPEDRIRRDFLRSAGWTVTNIPLYAFLSDAPQAGKVVDAQARAVIVLDRLSKAGIWAVLQKPPPAPDATGLDD